MQFIPTITVARAKTRVPYWGLLLLLVLDLALAVGFIARVYTAFGTSRLLDWDETYYANIAVTAAHGLGLYPYVQNSAQMPIMGGVGYTAYLYVFAVQALGPTIFSLRLVSVVVGFSALIPIYLVARLWYGSAAGLVAVALTLFFNLFIKSNTTRLDTITIAAISWGLFAAAYAWNRNRWRWHFIAGLVFGLALQAHIHTVPTAFACGVVYLIGWIRDIRRTGRWTFLKAPLAAFVLGYALGVGFYVVFNVLPDRNSYWKITAGARIVAARVMQRYDPSSLAETFLSPGFIIGKEVQRYTRVLQNSSPIEVILFVLGVLALVIRRGPNDKRVAVLLVATFVASAIILNGTSDLYAIHIWPVLQLPIAPLFTHGFSRSARSVPISWQKVAPLSVLALALALLLLGRPAWTIVRAPPPLARSPQLSTAPAIVQSVHRIASTECQIAGDAGLYAAYFMTYPRFNSSRRNELRLGATFFDVKTEYQMWTILNPDLFFGATVSPDLALYIQRQGYEAIAPGIWRKTNGPLTPGCVISPP